MAHRVEGLIRHALPGDADFPAGTPVEGTDHNAASSLLFRWMALWEAPATFALDALWRDLFDNDAVVQTPDARGEGIAAIAEAVRQARSTAKFAHIVDFDAVTLKWQGLNLFRLSATIDQQRATGSADVEQRRVERTADLRKRDDGRLVFRSIVDRVVGALPRAPLSDSFAVTRAKATMIQFQTHADLLTGDAGPMAELLMPALELNGLVNSKADATDADTAFTDVRDLREAISREHHKHDNVIRDFDAFAGWFRNCASLFRKGGFHKLERFEVTPLGDARFQVIAQFHWNAETVNGAPIDLHVPLTWVLAETGDTFMRIEKLLPFG